jgi:uncharacterized membrane protein
MNRLLGVGIAVIVVGFILIVAGSAGQGNVSAGGVIFIGPFPLAFGSGPQGWQLAIASVLIGGVMLALFVLWGWRFSRMKQG